MRKMNQKGEKSSIGDNNSVELKNMDNTNLLPHLETLERMMKIPVVEAAWQQSQSVYESVKGHNRMFNWAFVTAEGAITTAFNTAAPIVSKFDRPITFVDQTLVKGIEKLEVKVPLLKDEPKDIYIHVKDKVIEAVQPICALRVAGQQKCFQKAESLKSLSWQKANEVLATQYGTMAVNGLDSTSALAERLLDYYFPKTENDPEADNVPISSDQDKALHTVQTIGCLSNKVARRVWATVSHQIKHLKKEDIQEYVASLIAVLRLTQYLNYINEKVHGGSSNEDKPESNNELLIMDSLIPNTTIPVVPQTFSSSTTTTTIIRPKSSESIRSSTNSKFVANGKPVMLPGSTSNGALPKYNKNSHKNSNNFSNYDSNNDKLD